MSDATFCGIKQTIKCSHITHTPHPRSCVHDHTRGRTILQLSSVVKYNADYMNTCVASRARVVLRRDAAKITQHHVLILPSSISATGAHVRGCNECECSHRNQRARLQRIRVAVPGCTATDGHARVCA